jgi:hypothetical protein
MTRYVDHMAILAAALLGFSCVPNVVVGTREIDAGVVDAARPLPPKDAGRDDAARPVPPADAGNRRDAAPPALDASAMNNNDQADSGPGCTIDAQCTDSDEPRCDVGEGRCVECLSDDDCEPTQLCEDDGECSARPVPCTGPAQCAGSDEPVCHPALQVCVECADDDDCPANETCQPDNECD